MIFKNLTKIVLIFLIISCTTKSTDLSLNQTYKDKFTKFGNRKSAIFVHGLNQKPNKLESIMRVFYDLGYDCYLVHLKGHGKNYIKIKDLTKRDSRMESFKNAKFEDWTEDFHKTYSKVNTKYDENIIFGYSLGAVVALNYINEYKLKDIDKIFLIAPAIAIHTRSYIFKLLSFAPSIVIPSLAPINYRSNDGTPVQAYMSLYEGIDKFENTNTDYLNITTTLIVNEDDELVSYDKIKNLVQDKKLNKWNIITIKKDNVVDDLNYEHLIIDKPTLGDKSWSEIKKIIKESF